MSTLYERAGGTPWFEALVERFYAGVENDPVLRPLYPKNLTHSKAHLAAFLVQYWGGPDDYSIKRGHPRLRMRHGRWQIGWEERNAWFRHMEEAVKQGGLSPEDEAQMIEYFNTSATFLVNRPDLTADEPIG